MSTYVMPNRQKQLLGAGMVLGIVCLALSWFFDSTPFHTRFWSNLLQNSVFFTVIAMLALFFYSVCNTAWAGWHVQFKRVWESMSMFLFIGLGLMTLIALGVVFGWHHLYHWADAASIEHDAILEHKSSFLNKGWYIVSVVVIAVWGWFALRIRKLSMSEDTTGGIKDYNHLVRMRWLTAGVLPVIGFTSCLVIWQWVMSLDAHWYSTLFAWYSGASAFVAMIALTILVLLYMKTKGYYPNVNANHFHDLGKFMFAFSIFWTYLWFSQFMLIWYANNGEETVYFATRQKYYPVLFYANLVINFLVPFFVLMRNDNKRKKGTLITVAVLVFLGHWMDYFLMVKPGALHTAHEIHSEMHGGGHHGHGEDVYGAHDDHHGEGHDDAGHHDDHAVADSHEDHHGDDDHHEDAHHDDDLSDAHHDDHADDHHVAEAGAHGGGHGHDDHGHGAHGHEAKEVRGVGHYGGHAQKAGHGHGFEAGFTLPGFIEIGTMLGFLSLFLYIFFSSMTKANTIPKNDPYLSESLHHHVV